ncbi:MAG: CsbD family protein [Terriglobia bacterium]
MKRSTRNKAKGKYHEVKGTMKEKAGKLIKSPKWEAEGQHEKLTGQAQNAIGKVEDVLGA